MNSDMVDLRRKLVHEPACPTIQAGREPGIPSLKGMCSTPDVYREAIEFLPNRRTVYLYVRKQLAGI